nr:hydantoinase B/oxoprolinase family protein [Pelagibacteraceae bacterium]
MNKDLHHYKCGIDRKVQKTDVDPITTQIVRNSLNSAAEQMKRALCRTAMSPIIYEVLDFAAAIYDRDLRMLSQAPSLPLFMGTLNFCIEEAVKGVGGEENLYEGDIIIYNSPYG